MTQIQDKASKDRVIPILPEELEEFENEVKSYNSMFSFGIDFIYDFFKLNRDLVPKNISKKIFNFINANKNIKDLSIKFADGGNL